MNTIFRGVNSVGPYRIIPDEKPYIAGHGIVIMVGSPKEAEKLLVVLQELERQDGEMLHQPREE